MDIQDRDAFRVLRLMESGGSDGTAHLNDHSTLSSVARQMDGDNNLAHSRQPMNRKELLDK